MDSFWITWFVGIALVAGVRIFRCIVDNVSMNERKRNTSENLIFVLSLICVAIVGGIIVAKWIGTASNHQCDVCTAEGKVCVGNIIFMILTTLAGAALTYGLGYLILGLYHFEEVWAHILAVVIFILSIIAWSIPIWQYNKNIEYKQETITQTEQRELIYFAGISVSKSSGNVSDSPDLNSDSVEGKITTSDEIPYWYMNKNGKGVQGIAPSSKSEMDFFEGDSTAYVEIITNTTYTTKINHNNGKEGEAKEDSKSVKYIFHLPQYVTQYSLG